MTFLISKHTTRSIKFALAFSAALLCCSQSAAGSSLEAMPQTLRSSLPLPDIEATSWLLADFESGWVIHSVNANARIEPASLTKLMTGYLVFEALDKGEIELQTAVRISEKSWKTGGSRMFLEAGASVAVEKLLRGLIIQSGNDAAVALAEHMSGSEAEFAVKMNQMAVGLGMLNSRFTNSSGLPHAEHYSTAFDMTLLAMALIRDFPEYYRIYSEKSYTYNNITQKNRNVLLWRDASIDGIKTGYTEKAGYCLIGTANRQVGGQNMRLIATVIGALSESARAAQVHALLQYGYAAYEGMVAYRPADAVASLPLWMGRQPLARVGVDRDLSILYPAGGKGKLSAALSLPASLEAPLRAGQAVGRIEVKYADVVIRAASLHVDQAYLPGPWWSRALDSVKRLFFDWMDSLSGIAA